MKVKESQIPELIKQGKDKEAIQTLYTNVLPNIKKYVMRNGGSADDAFDLFQEGLMAFYQTVVTGKFNINYTVYGYLYKLCVFRWINKAGRNTKIVFKEDLEGLKNTQVQDLYIEEVIDNEANVLKKFFSVLGDRCIELLTYTIFKDMLAEDIMIRLGFPSIVSVRMQHMRCKEKLLQEIEKNPVLLDKLKGI